MTVDAVSLKEQGNQCFNRALFDQAYQLYCRALSCCPENDTTFKATLFKNLSAVSLKQNNYTKAEDYATSALNLNGNDPKALYRRAQARERLQKYTDAIRDARLALQYEPGNRAVQQLLESLMSDVDQKRTALSSCAVQVGQMLSCLQNESQSSKLETAVNNLATVSRQPYGADEVFKQNGHSQLANIVRHKENVELLVAGYRCLACMVHNQLHLNKMFTTIPLEEIVALMNRNHPDVVKAASSLTQRIFSVLMKGSPSEDSTVSDSVVSANQVLLVDLLFEIKAALVRPTVTALTRNGLLSLLSKNLMHTDGGLPRGWSVKFVQQDGLEALLKVACNVPEQAVLPVNAETRQHVAICLSKLYEDMMSDSARDAYKTVVKRFVEAKTQSLTDEVKIQICSLAIAMLMGPVDVAFSFIGDASYTDLLLEMADSPKPLLKSVAADAIVATVSKRDRCSVFLNKGLSVLRKLYKSEDPKIRVKALVGLCKCASSGGNDISLRPMKEEKLLRLSEACKRFLLDNRDVDVQCLAAEALAYLVLDADVKEWLVGNVQLIRALVALAKQAGSVCAFAVGSIFVNLTNTYDKVEVTPELVKIAEFAKHHVPKQHPKDADDFVSNRIDLLINEGGTAAVVALSDTESLANREMIVRVLHGFCQEPKHRGTVVQEGGAKVLLKLTSSNTEVGKKLAAHGLAKICITIDPAIALPGQRSHDAIRPLVGLLTLDNSGLECYEALLALTNLAALDDSHRLTMLNVKVMPAMEEFWFLQDDQLLRAAAAELFLNLLHCEKARKLVSTAGTDRLKLWVLYCKEDDDDRLAMAAVSAMVLLTDDDVDTCRRVVNEVSCWLEVLQVACSRTDVELRRRGLLFAVNMAKSCPEVAAQMMQSSLLEMLVAIVKLDHAGQSPSSEQKVCAQLANQILTVAEKFDLIKPTDRELYERTTGTSTVSLN